MSDLIARLEAGEGADRELNRDLHEAITGECVHRETKSYFIEDGNDYDSGFTCVKCGEDTYGHKIPPYTSSLDAAIALVEKMLPGWDWYVRHATSADGDARYGNAQIWRPCDPRDDEAPRHWANHNEPVRALLIALLRSQEPEESSK
jgi:hypothetical protein